MGPSILPEHIVLITTTIDGIGATSRLSCGPTHLSCLAIVYNLGHYRDLYVVVVVVVTPNLLGGFSSDVIALHIQRRHYDQWTKILY